jgi:hypothetical protein
LRDHGLHSRPVRLLAGGTVPGINMRKVHWFQKKWAEDEPGTAIFWTGPEPAAVLLCFLSGPSSQR